MKKMALIYPKVVQGTLGTDANTASLIEAVLGLNNFVKNDLALAE